MTRHCCRRAVSYPGASPQRPSARRVSIMTQGTTHAHAAAVRPASYGHGTILASAADEAHKSTHGRRMIRERVMALGQDSIYNPPAMHPDVRAYLVQRGIDPSHHRQRRVSAEFLKASDLVIAMSTDHQAFLLNTFRYPAL